MNLNVGMNSSSKNTQSKITGSYGVVDRMLHGFGTVHSDLAEGHPLEKKLQQFKSNQDKINFSMLRKTQGVHAPLRLMMERKAAFQVQRLPCLPSSNAMLDALTGDDEVIGFEDVLNNYEDSETLIQPHIMVEKSLGLI